MLSHANGFNQPNKAHKGSAVTRIVPMHQASSTLMISAMHGSQGVSQQAKAALILWELAAHTLRQLDVQV